MTWGLMPTLDAIAGTLVLFAPNWRLALVASPVWPWCGLVPARLAPDTATKATSGAGAKPRRSTRSTKAIAGHGVVPRSTAR